MQKESGRAFMQMLREARQQGEIEAICSFSFSWNGRWLSFLSYIKPSSRTPQQKTVQYRLSAAMSFLFSFFNQCCMGNHISHMLPQLKKKSQFRNNCHCIAYFPHYKALKEQEKAICCNLAALSILG